MITAESMRKKVASTDNVKAQLQIQALETKLKSTETGNSVTADFGYHNILASVRKEFEERGFVVTSKYERGGCGQRDPDYWNVTLTW